MPATRFGTKFRLATREARHAVLGAELAREEVIYTALDECHDAMLWLRPNYECNLYWDNTRPF